VPVVYLPGPPVQPVTPLDFGHTAELIAASYEACTAFLARIEIKGPGLYGHPSGTY
jgi:NTE family protein